MANGNGGNPDEIRISLDFNVKTGKLQIHGLTPERHLAILWMLDRMHSLLRENTGPQQVAAAIGEGSSGIVVARGAIPPFPGKGK